MPTLKLDDFLPYRLSIASNRVSSAIATAYQSMFGLKIPEWRLIAVIAEGEGMTQQALGIATQMDKVTVSRAAIGLETRGLIVRRSDPADKRSRLLSLSDGGRALYDKVSPKALELEAEIFAGWSTAEIAAFRAQLARIERATGGFDAQHG